jgi:PilZ domain
MAGPSFAQRRIRRQRRFHRAPLQRAVLFAPKGEDVFCDGVAMDISLGGMFIATELPDPFGAEIVVLMRVERSGPDLALPAVVRWTRQDGMGVQFGLLGARATFEITEILREHAKNAR